jgi:hypothetical protein
MTSRALTVGGLKFRAQGTRSALVAENPSFSRPEVAIPAAIQVDGKAVPVTSVGVGAFHTNGKITVVRFAANSAVTSVDERAFNY